MKSSSPTTGGHADIRSNERINSLGRPFTRLAEARPAPAGAFLGIPPSDSRFYPSLLGAVLFGIGVALVQETKTRHGRGSGGLGLMGAVTINLCAGIVLAGWLLAGVLDLPDRGIVFLWLLVAPLAGISGVGLFIAARQQRDGVLSD